VPLSITVDVPEPAVTTPEAVPLPAELLSVAVPTSKLTVKVPSPATGPNRIGVTAYDSDAAVAGDGLVLLVTRLIAALVSPIVKFCAEPTTYRIMPGVAM
jgi:hypothetical protein